MSANRIRAVIDTQLYLRAVVNLKSLPAKIIFDLRHAYQLIASEAILLEIRDVLNRPKIRAKFPHLTDELVNKVIALISDAEIVKPSEIPVVSRDPKDDIFLACAKISGAHYLVSEDNDLLVLHSYEGVRIINALEFLQILQNDTSL